MTGSLEVPLIQVLVIANPIFGTLLLYDVILPLELDEDVVLRYSNLFLVLVIRSK